MLWATQRNGQTSPSEAWITLLERAGTILRVPGICLFKNPNLATEREVIKKRAEGQGAFGVGTGTNHWVSHGLLEPHTICSVWGFICQGGGMRPGPSPVKGWTASQAAAQMSWLVIQKERLAGSQEHLALAPAWAPWVWATDTLSLHLRLFICRLKLGVHKEFLHRAAGVPQTFDGV